MHPGPFTHTETQVTGCRERALGSVWGLSAPWVLGRGRGRGLCVALGSHGWACSLCGLHVDSSLIRFFEQEPEVSVSGVVTAVCLGLPGRGRARRWGWRRDVGHPLPRTGSAAGRVADPVWGVLLGPGRLWGALGGICTGPRGEWKFLGRGPGDVPIPHVGRSCQGPFQGVSTPA